MCEKPRNQYPAYAANNSDDGQKKTKRVPNDPVENKTDSISFEMGTQSRNTILLPIK